MNSIIKIFGFLIVLCLVNLGASNSDTIIFRFWPFDFGVEINLGFCLVVVFLFAFFAGGLYIWLCNAKKLKKIKKQLNNAYEKNRGIE